MDALSIKQPRTGLFINTDTVTLVYILTEACNFRCTYCYESVENSMLQQKPCKGLTFTLADMIRAYDIFSHQISVPVNSIVFFGGEPFVQKKLIQDFICALKEREEPLPEFAAITNASLLDREFGQFVAENFSAITCSIDGIKAIHDRYRVDVNNAGTFDCVTENIKNFQCHNKHTDVALEVTLTDAYAQGNIRELCKENWDFFKSLSIRRIDYVPVQGRKYSIFKNYVEKPEIAKEIVNSLVDLWFDDFISLQISVEVVSFRNSLISILKKRTPNRCGAGQGYFAVTPDLSLYICQTALFVGDKPRWRLSDAEGVVEINGGFQEDTCLKKSQHFCRDCECRNGCTNYCRAQWEIRVPTELPDVCLFHRLVRSRIVEKIRILYECGEQETLKRAVGKYYGKKP